jgi:hypothetical protein
MFKSISWQEFLYAVAVLSGGYYIIVIAVFYSRDILNKLRGAPATSPKADPVNKKLNRSEKFMGAISTAPPKKIPIKVSTAGSDELIIESDTEELNAANRADSPAAELLDHLENLFLIMATEKIEKAKYMKSIRTLFLQYTHYNGTVRQEVNAFVIDHFKTSNAELFFSMEELTTLWLDEKDQTIYQSSTINNYEK